MLFKFFLIIFLIGFALVSLLGFSVLRSFKQFFFGSPKSKQRPTTQGRTNSQSRSSGSANRQQPNKKKIIAADEGEYVDYEEVRD